MVFDEDLRLHMQALRWVPADTRWAEVPWEDWSAFRDIFSTDRRLENVPPGVHHFVVVVRDHDRVPVNIIRHKYLIEPNGKEGWDNFGGLTKEERTEWSRAYLAKSMDEIDEPRIRQIENKAAIGMRLPPEAVIALRFLLKPAAQAGSAAERFLADPEGQLDTESDAVSPSGDAA